MTSCRIAEVVVVVLDYCRMPSNLNKLAELELLLVLFAIFGFLSLIGFCITALLIWLNL